MQRMLRPPPNNPLDGYRLPDFEGRYGFVRRPALAQINVAVAGHIKISLCPNCRVAEAGL
jgi:hypothetical protein